MQLPSQRWIPGGSFCKRLLPTDRYCWSSENGKEEKLKDNIKLPSFLWQWEHEWKLETTLEEAPLNDDVSLINMGNNIIISNVHHDYHL